MTKFVAAFLGTLTVFSVLAGVFGLLFFGGYLLSADHLADGTFFIALGFVSLAASLAFIQSRESK